MVAASQWWQLAPFEPFEQDIRQNSGPVGVISHMARLWVQLFGPEDLDILQESHCQAQLSTKLPFEHISIAAQLVPLGSGHYTSYHGHTHA